MSKSVTERIDAIRRKEERAKVAAKEAADEINRMITPIAEKLGAAVKARVEEDLKADIERVADVDFSREGIKAAVDAFMAAVLGDKSKDKSKRKAPAAAHTPAGGEVQIEA